MRSSRSSRRSRPLPPIGRWLHPPPPSHWPAAWQEGRGSAGRAPLTASGAAGTITRTPPRPSAGATPQELRAHPGLAGLLQGLGCVLGGDGLSPPLEKELRQAEAALALRRGAWLRWESLWRGLRELLRDPRGVEPPAVPRSLPPTPPPRIPPFSEPGCCPSWSTVWPRRWKNFPATTGGPPRPPQPPKTPPRGVAEGLAAEHHRLRRARRRHRSLSQLLERQRRAYPQVLGRCRELLARLAGERFAGAQAELDRRRAEYLEAKGTAVLLKIRLEELNVLLDTYPPEKVEAHRRIRAALEAAREGERLGRRRGARGGAGGFRGAGPPVRGAGGGVRGACGRGWGTAGGPCASCATTTPDL
ncbi:HAUS augmin-like complex subunit 4 [Harpia harpyja]|uniref:HAUS augmin-like complex subunit 4 n=1 Tax=Harpia harpyja TaxID=202280 RepID=UPI0022B0C878|nr:HAUS augmin-like complex subunit 4 [Harpia harpyja]